MLKDLFLKTINPLALTWFQGLPLIDADVGWAVATSGIYVVNVTPLMYIKTKKKTFLINFKRVLII